MPSRTLPSYSRGLRCVEFRQILTGSILSRKGHFGINLQTIKGSAVVVGEILPTVVRGTRISVYVASRSKRDDAESR